MIGLPVNVMKSIYEHVEKDVPKEACGLIVVQKGKAVYRACENVAYDPMKEFVIRTEDWVAAEDFGEVVMVVHSHVNRAPKPSPADIVMCEQTGVPWLIVNHPVGTTHYFEPTGYKFPRYGRPWVHGLLDCYTWCQDYYREELGLELSDYPREPEWWTKGHNLYRENFKKEGFVEVPITELKINDALLMMLQSKVENHAAVMVGDNIIGHHPMNRLSSRDVYGGWWRKCTTVALRHQSQL